MLRFRKVFSRQAIRYTSIFHPGRDLCERLAWPRIHVKDLLVYRTALCLQILQGLRLENGVCADATLPDLLKVARVPTSSSAEAPSIITLSRGSPNINVYAHC